MQRETYWSTLKASNIIDKNNNGENQRSQFHLHLYYNNLTSLYPSLIFLNPYSMTPFLFPPISFLLLTLVSAASFSEFIHPNFTASNFQFIDYSGSFLSSRNGTFRAAIFNPAAQQTNFYLCVIHVGSNTIIWSANGNEPISKSGVMNLTARGITISDQNGNQKWSTPPLQSPVYALQLTEKGNLVLLDEFNISLWESFQQPTDTIVIGQKLPVGMFLSSSVSGDNLSTGDYRFMVSEDDAVMRWQGHTYWKLSMDTRAHVNSNFAVEYMALDTTGFYLYGRNGTTLILQVSLSKSDFRVAKVVSSGHFTVSSISGGYWKQEFVSPVDGCQIPFICGRAGLCASGTTSSSSRCSCPENFVSAQDITSGCMPRNSSLSFPFACNSTSNGSQLNSSNVSYLMLGYGMDYFANIFSKPIEYGSNLSGCQNACSRDCSCMGIFYEKSSGSCYVVENQFGSVTFSSQKEDIQVAYVKTLVGPSRKNFDGETNPSNQGLRFPLAATVLLPLLGFLLLFVLVFLLWRSLFLKNNTERTLEVDSDSSLDLASFYIPGLPQKFQYKELEVATDNFRIQIGSGGFGSVYKGTLPDKSIVAIKKITELGVQGKKEFCTEIAVIGNIRHSNLVKLRGFCAHGRQFLLVYEYITHGSLDRTLFGSGPVLEWQERVDIALGTARGLTYLHTGCEQKIIHCDVKPENILLHDNFHPKIADFGLSKLLSPEQSSLFTSMRGTRGYLAPEWLTNAAITEKADVYSYGMVLLELVSGRKNCTLRSQSHSLDDDNSSDGCSLSSRSTLLYFPLYALEMHEQGRYKELADTRLCGRITIEEVEKLVCIALCCVHEEPALRPNMATIVGMLEGVTALCRPRVESLNFLRFYGRRFTDASIIQGDNGETDVMLNPQAVVSRASSASGTNTYFSYVSSQQMSGPR